MTWSFWSGSTRAKIVVPLRPRHQGRMGEPAHLVAGQDALDDQPHLLRDVPRDEVVVTGDDLERHTSRASWAIVSPTPSFGGSLNRMRPSNDEVALEAVGSARSGVPVGRGWPPSSSARGPGTRPRPAGSRPRRRRRRASRAARAPRCRSAGPCGPRGRGSSARARPRARPSSRGAAVRPPAGPRR